MNSTPERRDLNKTEWNWKDKPTRVRASIARFEKARGKVSRLEYLWRVTVERWAKPSTAAGTASTETTQAKDKTI
jgi:hypothetical protein